MKETENADDYRVKGEILTTYLNKVDRGMTSIELPNYYEEDKPIKSSCRINSPLRKMRSVILRNTKIKECR